MPARIGPRPFEPPTDAVVVPARHYDCERYEECLLVAARKLWLSWSCRGCPLCPDDVRIEVWKSSVPPSRSVLKK
jgi:hypothetical protein